MIPPTVAIIGSMATFKAAAAPATALMIPATGEIAATSPATVRMNACVEPSRSENHCSTFVMASTAFSSAGTSSSASAAPASMNAADVRAFSLSI